MVGVTPGTHSVDEFLALLLLNRCACGGVFSRGRVPPHITDWERRISKYFEIIITFYVYYAFF